MKNLIEININTINVEDVIIIVNQQKYRLEPVSTSQAEALQANMPTMRAFVSQLAQQLRQEGRIRTSETYRCATNKFQQFLPHHDIMFHQIDAQMIEHYERFLIKNGLSMNSTSFYMRVLRAIYNKAVDRKYTSDQQPFENVYTGIGKTIKRAIPLDAIQRIRQLTSLNTQQELARDLFLFSFYTRGMSFIDMAYLTPENIHDGLLVYRRHKTSQELTISWEPQMQDIVNRHPSPNKGYLLPIIKRNNGCERSQYRETQRLVNILLKEIAQKANINTPLTMYVARHSWASIARCMSVPVNIISEGMGHHSEKTTQIYLKSLNNKELNRANAVIIQAVNNPPL